MDTSRWQLNGSCPLPLTDGSIRNIALRQKSHSLELGECRAVIMLPYPIHMHPLPWMYLPFLKGTRQYCPFSVIPCISSLVLMMGGLNEYWNSLQRTQLFQHTFAERVLHLQDRGTRWFSDSQLQFMKQLQLHPVQDTNINTSIGWTIFWMFSVKFSSFLG